MKLMVLILIMSCITLATEDTPKYACPEEDVDFYGNDMLCDGYDQYQCSVTGVVIWEDCGKLRY